MKNLELYGEDWMRAIEGKKKKCVMGKGYTQIVTSPPKKLGLKLFFVSVWSVWLQRFD